MPDETLSTQALVLTIRRGLIELRTRLEAATFGEGGSAVNVLMDVCDSWDELEQALGTDQQPSDELIERRRRRQQRGPLLGVAQIRTPDQGPDSVPYAACPMYPTNLDLLAKWISDNHKALEAAHLLSG